jgi:hypothetical protein
MRFISPFERYRLVAVHQEIETLANGQPRILSEGYTAEFTPGDTTDYERETAREHFKFRNIVKNMDGTFVDPVHRVSSFDTATIRDKDLRRRVEQFMLDPDRSPDLGKAEGYMLVEKPQLPAPWPAYDDLTVQGRRSAEHVAAKNLEIAAATGVQIDALIAYERQADEPRAEVIAAYEAALATDDEPKPELVEA